MSKVSQEKKYECLEVTAVQVYPFCDPKSLGYIKARAYIVLNDQFLIRCLRVMDGGNGLFVGYPIDYMTKSEEFPSVCNPITRELKEHIDDAVLGAYNKMMEESNV